MGAQFNYMTIDGKATKEQVKEKFNQRVSDDGYECGHSYSGSFSEFSGLGFTDAVFDTFDEAEAYVSEHGEKWGPAVAVRHKAYDMPKSVLAHEKQRTALMRKIWDAEAGVRVAQEKARINNRSTTPSYVTKAEAKLEKVRAQVQPKIDERTAKIDTIIKKTAAKSKKFVWLLGGWCSS